MAGILQTLISGFISRLFTWTTQDSGIARIISAGVYAPLTNGSYFFFQNGGSQPPATTAYMYSSDGNTWNSGTLPSAIPAAGAASDGTTIVVLPGNTGTKYTFVLTSTNGTTWTSRTFATTSVETYDIIHDGTRFWVVSNDNALTLRYSTDGTTWSTVNLGIGMQSIGSNGSRWITTQAGTTALGSTSTSPLSGGNWSSITLPSSRTWVNPVYGNGVWAVFADGVTAYATSQNGTTWTARTLPVAFGVNANIDRNRTRAAFFGGAFYYCALGNIYRSVDAINWTIATSTLFPQANTSLQAVGGWAVGPRVIAGGYSNISDTFAGSDIVAKGD